MNYLHDNLIFLRKLNGFTQDDVAEKMFVSRQAVSKWERGESVPDLETITALSDLYGVKIDDIVKKDLKEAAPKTAPTKSDVQTEFSGLKRVRNKQTAKLMVFWAVALVAVYSLICGIIQTSFHAVTEHIWIIWFTLPVIPPIIFAIRFRHNIGAEWIMFFVDVPFIAGIIYMLNVFYDNYDGAWLAFLMIPIYYAIAVTVCVYIRRQKKKNKSAQNQNKDDVPRE